AIAIERQQHLLAEFRALLEDALEEIGRRLLIARQLRELADIEELGQHEPVIAERGFVLGHGAILSLSNRVMAGLVPAMTITGTWPISNSSVAFPFPACARCGPRCGARAARTGRPRARAPAVCPRWSRRACRRRRPSRRGRVSRAPRCRTRVPCLDDGNRRARGRAPRRLSGPAN